ncbi:MAG: four helix bundle protein [Mongoliibacter sp.]|uniref:four helix bundle protein n=1 Tax=Mongoliibacter sp. TaxID=2022438 RepID=UPI0012F334A5|nr:four helix bundle protein [Mongoliibacter sp.]TVP49133.1 MAG: four helix bundle protein [Mongoliibacter sp.]
MKREIQHRTKQFAIEVWGLCAKFPHTREFNAYVNQLIRCSSSVAANYRSACRAKSNADFINKLKIVEEEADESQFFLELIAEINTNDQLSFEINRLIKEADEIVAIIVASLKTLRTS